MEPGPRRQLSSGSGHQLRTRLRVEHLLCDKHRAGCRMGIFFQTITPPFCKMKTKTKNIFLWVVTSCRGGEGEEWPRSSRTLFPSPTMSSVIPGSAPPSEAVSSVPVSHGLHLPVLPHRPSTMPAASVVTVSASAGHWAPSSPLLAFPLSALPFYTS